MVCLSLAQKFTRWLKNMWKNRYAIKYNHKQVTLTLFISTQWNGWGFGADVPLSGMIPQVIKARLISNSADRSGLFSAVPAGFL